MRASTKRIISILASAALLIATLVLWQFAISGEYDAVQKLRGEVASKLEAAGNAEAAVKQLRKIIEEFQGITRVQESFNLSLPNSENLPQAIGQIQGIAAAANLTLQSMGVEILPLRVLAQGASKDFTKAVGVIRLNFGLLGTYESFRSFLQALETNVRIFDTFDVTISRAGGSANRNLYLYNLSVDTYYQSLSKEAF
jgi:Tfp pilus assembly protein PilO